MWENSLEKLKILNYENSYCKKYNRRPFNRVHFVLPTNNASQQFDDFSTICSWLCTEITLKADTFKPEQFDDPNTIVNKLMLALRQFDFRSSFPPQKLKTPNGEPTCTVLEFLTDKALQTKGFQWEAPVHSTEDDVSACLLCFLSCFIFFRLLSFLHLKFTVLCCVLFVIDIVVNHIYFFTSEIINTFHYNRSNKHKETKMKKTSSKKKPTEAQ